MDFDRSKVLVGISGGIESAVTAALLKSEGYQVHGLHLAYGNAAVAPRPAADAALHPLTQGLGGGADPQGALDFKTRCLGGPDAETVRKLCAKIGIPLQIVDVSEDYRDKVVDYVVHQGIQSRAVNPCVPCNSQIRMRWLLKTANEHGCHWIATGHYAQVTQDTLSGFARLQRAVDGQADQSFLLWALQQEVLSRMILPLGGLSRSMVRKLAQEFGIPAADRDHSSSEPCMADDAAVIRFVEKRTTAGLRLKGLIRTAENKVVGSHQGLFRFRVGQKVGGLELPDKNNVLFVTDFDAKTHGVIVGPEPELFLKELVALQVNWIKPVDELRPLRCSGRVAAAQADVGCMVTCFENDTIHVKFDEPLRAVNAGQPVVFYEGDEILGGAWVESTSVVKAGS